MTKKQILSIISAMEASNMTLAKDESLSEKVRTRAAGYALGYATVLMMFENPKYAKDLAEIYEVEI